MCGFIALQNSRDAVCEIHDALVAIQHRGQDSAGIATLDEVFHLHKGLGLVREVFDAPAIHRLPGHFGVGHVRYPTVGGGREEDAQPFVQLGAVPMAIAHNGNVVNYEELRAELVAEGCHVASHCDVEVILHVLAGAFARATEDGERAITDAMLVEAVGEVFRRVHGAYSVVVMLEDGTVLGFRDPFGIKPIAIGRRDGPDGPAHAVASESVVLEMLGFEPFDEPAPGEVVRIAPGGEVTRLQVVEADLRPCLFEYVYFARPDSHLNGSGVYRSRMRMGEHLARRFRETGIEADVVVPVPDSARTASQAMALELGLPFREALVKNRYIGRTFIMPSDGARKRSVRHKLNLIREEFDGKRVLIVDDSIVRGSTSRSLVAAAREAGARAVHLAVTAPPLRHPCPYGIDMATRSEFIARDRSAEEVAEELGADSVLYQRLEDLEDSVRADNPRLEAFCSGCFTGCYPTGDVTPERLRAIEEERLAQAAASQESLPFFR